MYQPVMSGSEVGVSVGDTDGEGDSDALFLNTT